MISWKSIARLFRSEWTFYLQTEVFEQRTKDYTVATYEQIKRGLLNFQPKQIVEADGIHVHPLNS